MSNFTLARAQSIAALMGFTAGLLHPNNGDYGFYVITDAEGRRFSVHEGTARPNRGRLVVDGDWPNKGVGRYSGAITPASVREDSPTITISLDKDDQQIVADIKRRFLPDFQRIYDKCLERVAQLQEEDATELAMKLKIQEAYGKPLSEDELKGERRLHLYVKTGYLQELEINPHSETVSGRFSGVPLEAFIELLRKLN